ncbi:MAG: hypothetical protein LBL52_01425 [Rickettsiales bacterium]|jgi:hypothetical protein|nr:hypothetical protein [Rickettsiales bacterium]
MRRSKIEHSIIGAGFDIRIFFADELAKLSRRAYGKVIHQDQITRSWNNKGHIRHAQIIEICERRGLSQEDYSKMLRSDPALREIDARTEEAYDKGYAIRDKYLYSCMEQSK